MRGEARGGDRDPLVRLLPVGDDDKLVVKLRLNNRLTHEAMLRPVGEAGAGEGPAGGVATPCSLVGGVGAYLEMYFCSFRHCFLACDSLKQLSFLSLFWRLVSRSTVD